MDRQLALNESVLRTKVMRRDPAFAGRRGKAN
jgi:small subunit ribosomal protein S6